MKRGSPGPERRPAGEAALVRAAQAGSEQALASLFDAHWPRAHRAAYLIVRDAAAAEDIAQEALLAAIRALHRFDRRRPFGPWLHRIVVNRAIDWSRARALRREVSEDGLPEAPEICSVERAADAGLPPRRITARALSRAAQSGIRILCAWTPAARRRPSVGAALPPT